LNDKIQYKFISIRYSLTSRFLTKYEKAIQINNDFEVFVEVPNE
jgi:hypothetical protein